VLGLPLAFILSQDQTLHCKKFNLLAIPFSCFTAALFQRTFSLSRVDNFCRNGRQTYYQVSSQSKSFFKNFSEPHPNFYLPSLFDWGGKSNQNFFSSKFISKFFFQEPEPMSRLPSLFYRGGKSTTSFRFIPNLFSKIFLYSLNPHFNHPFFIGAAKVICLVSSFQIYFKKFFLTSKTRFPFVSKNVSISEKRVQK
jgi:hypothetical protein